MSRRERRGPVGLLARQAASDAPLICLVALVVAMTAFLVTAAPAALASIATQELRHTLNDFPAVRRDLTASGFFGYPSAGGGRSTAEGLAAISDTIQRAPAGLGPPLTSLLESPQWAATTDRDEVQVVGSTPGVVGMELGLAVTPGWLAQVEITDGRAPTAWEGDDDDLESGAAAPAVEIAVSSDAAEQMGIAVGDLLAFDIAPLRVTGLYRPADPDDDLWQHQPQLAAPFERRADDGRKLLVADAFVDPESTAGLSDSFAEARLHAWYPLRAAEFGFDDAPIVAQQVRQLSATGDVFPSGEFLMFSSILASDLDAITQRVAVSTSLIVLLIAGPIGVVLAVLALAAHAIAQRRTATFTLARVRGASGTRLRLAMLLEGLLIAVPAAALGAGAAVAVTIATGGQPDVGAVVPGALVVIAAPPALLAAAVPRPARVDGSPTAGWRWVGELVVVGLAAASVFLLIRRGVVDSGDGPDPLLAAAPLLVAAAGTFGVLRAYPLMMRAAQRSSRRGRGAVALVGTARATYAPTLGFATAFALIVGISVAVFSLGAASSLALCADAGGCRDPTRDPPAGCRSSARRRRVRTAGDRGRDHARALPRRGRARSRLHIASARRRGRHPACARLLARAAAGRRGVGARAGRSGRDHRRRRARHHRGARRGHRDRSAVLRRCRPVRTAPGPARHHRARRRDRSGSRHDRPCCRRNRRPQIACGFAQNGDGMTAQITCIDLVRIFSSEGVEVQALQGLNLEVEAGELTAIVGASGSGKSTLLTILSGLDTPTAGSATVDGHDLLAMRGRERTQYRRETVGFIFQQTDRNLVPFLSVAENITMALSVARAPRSRRAERVDGLLDVLGLGDLRARTPAELSGGQRQRAAIAVALANAPRVLLADEPTGELDEQSSAEILEVLRELNEKIGVTVLIVTHDEAVSAHVRRTVQIRDGRTSTELLRSLHTGDDGVQRHIAREYAVLDRVGRLQLPQDYLTRLRMSGLVRLELESDHVEVHRVDENGAPRRGQ